MAQRRVVDVSMLQGLVEGSENQEIVQGVRKSTDPRFPVFATPVGTDILVYIPRTNMAVTENGEAMKMLESHLHDYKNGQSFGQFRCINGLGGNALFDALGYDGTCPACDGMKDVWELYRLKMAAEGKRLGVDPQNDPTDILKPSREKILGEMDLKNPEEYVTFPIVIIPTKGKMMPADDAMAHLQVVFVTWRKKRYNDTIAAALESLMNNPGHPAGLFWFWKFTYDTKGKQANARDAARNAKYSVIQDATALNILQPIKDACEEAAKEFTLVKAAEVVVANQFMYKEDLEAEVNKVMAKTRQFIELASVSGGAPAIGAPATPAGQIGSGAAGLAGFGVADGSTPANLGGAPAGGNPVKFG